jgi:hypothetical protein
MCAFYFSYCRNHKIGGTWLRQKARPHVKNNQREKTGSMIQVVEYLPRKCEEWSSHCSTAKKKKKDMIYTNKFENFIFY